MRTHQLAPEKKAASPISSFPRVRGGPLQRTCACGGTGALHHFGSVRVNADTKGARWERVAHVDGLDADAPSSSVNPSSKPASPSSKQAATTPCPTSVSVGAVAQRNHGDLSPTDKERWGTWLGAMSRMDVGPGPDHTGHCMKERLTAVSNNCPEAVYTRGGETIQPCTGDKCLDINRYGSTWGVSDGPTAFLDMHRTRARSSLLEGTGVNSCSVVCEQTYTCDRTHATTGTFQITRSFQAGSHTRADGSSMHITTGTVTKT